MRSGVLNKQKNEKNDIVIYFITIHIKQSILNLLSKQDGWC